jgi:N-acetylmuramoyl-L-alanine amidase
VLKSADDREKIAERVFQAFKEYKEIYEGTEATETAPATQSEVEKPAAKQETKVETVYAVQIFAVGKKMDPKAREFMGYTPKIIQGEKLYKYYIGVSDSAAGARKHLSAIRKKYPDAFLVKICGTEVTRIN